MHDESLVIEFPDMGEMTASHPILKQRYVQLDRGAFRGDVVGIPIDGGLFWRSRANRGGCGSADIAGGHLLIAVVGLNCRKELWHGREVDAGSLALGNHQTGLEHRAGSNHESYAWLIPLERYRSDAEALGLDVPALDSVTSPLVSGGQYGTERIRGVIDAALSFAALNPHALLGGMTWFENALISATLHSLATARPALTFSRAVPSLARAARDLIHEHASKPLSIVELCRWLSASERTLRHQFALAYQCSPMEYQLALRLKLVQERLRRARPQKGGVGHVATAFGFWHMGRFAAQYRRLLGESPSQTLLGSPHRSRGWLPNPSPAGEHSFPGDALGKEMG